MALTTKQSDWLTTATNKAGEIVTLENTLRQLKAVYYSEGVGDACTDEELQALPEYKHLSHNEVVALETAIEAVLTALGDYVTGELGNFLKASRNIGK